MNNEQLLLITAALSRAQLAVLEGYPFSASTAIGEATRLLDAQIEQIIDAKAALGAAG